MDKIKIGLVFGGKSGEHEVSVRSAASVYKALDKKKYDVALLGVDKFGAWHLMDQKWLPTGAMMKSLPSGDKALMLQNENFDVFFPIIHGTFGEDGCMQGLFELMNTAYVGAGVLGSAIGMDKDVQKRLLMQAGIPVAKYRVIYDLPAGRQVFNYPVFVKPANLGSSVGVSKCKSKNEIIKAAELAFKYDTKVLIEDCIKGREIEVAVLDGKASLPGEIIPKGKHEFYDYEAKYTDENGAELQIPAAMTKHQITRVQRIAEKVFEVLECEGMARVDMFFKKDGQIVINEINTIPGFTDISMYPKLWEASGVPYPELLERLIQLAIDRKKVKDKLKRSYNTA